MKHMLLIKYHSSARLNRYLRASNGHTRLSTKLYYLNSDISAELFKQIGYFEVALRNVIDHQAQQILGKKNWFGQLKDPRSIEVVKEATRISKDKSHDQIITSLSFGFWSKLFSGRDFIDLGSKILTMISPKTKHNIKQIRDQFHHLKIIRNRIAHHEPIIFFSDNRITLKNVEYAQNNLRALAKKFSIDQEIIFAHNQKQLERLLKKLIPAVLSAKLK